MIFLMGVGGNISRVKTRGSSKLLRGHCDAREDPALVKEGPSSEAREQFRHANIKMEKPERSPHTYMLTF